MREAASRGFWVAPMAPYGYKRVKVLDGPKERPTLEPNEDAALVVKRIFDLAESRKGMLKIVRILNDEGIASPRGKLWNKPTVHNILRNEAYLGTLVWGNNAKDNADPVRVEKAFPAVVTKAQFDRVNTIMRSRAPRVSPGSFQPLPGPSLDGLDLLVGHPLRRTWSGPGRRRPRGCPRWPTGSGSTGPQPPPGTGSSPSGHEGRRCS